MQSTISSGNKETLFQKEVNKTYVREGRFKPYIGVTSNAIFQVNEKIKKTSIPLIGTLSGAGVRGSTQLTGAEEALSNYDFTFEPTYVRNAVLVDNEENEKAAFDLFKEAYPSLKDWLMQLKRDQMIQALGAIYAGSTYYNYGGSAASGATGSSAASGANMDTWQSANRDRILYGSSKGNLTAGDHTTSLGTIDTTNDRLTPESISLAKRMATSCNPLIRPVMINDDEPWFVYFTGAFSMRDLRSNATMTAALREAAPRLQSNPLFSGGDLVWDGVIIKEVPDIDKFIDNTSGTGLFDGVWGANATGDSLLTSGNGGTRVGVGFLCGAQAVVFGRGIEAKMAERKEDDYQHQRGVAIVAKHDIKKTFYNGKQFGMVTHFHSAPADA